MLSLQALIDLCYSYYILVSMLEVVYAIWDEIGNLISLVLSSTKIHVRVLDQR